MWLCGGGGEKMGRRSKDGEKESARERSTEMRANVENCMNHVVYIVFVFEYVCRLI